MRASQAPEQWNLILGAMRQDDYDLAHNLAIKHGFADEPKPKPKVVVGTIPRQGDFVARSPQGKISCHRSAKQLSLHLGFSDGYIHSRTKKTGKQTIIKGSMKGWVFWREK